MPVMARFAALDVGSNAMRVRIVEVHVDGSPKEQLGLLGQAAPQVREIASLRAPVRLGGEVFATGRLTPASIGQACAALRDFRAAMDAAKVDVYRATATSAVREAGNGAILVERARREAGIELEIIEGVEEARLIQLAVARRVNLADKRALLVDVGGGSTELTYLDRGRNAFAMSLPMGTVRLLETYLRGAATIEKKRQRLLIESIDRALVEVAPQLGNIDFDLVIGTGGSVDTLEELCPTKGGFAGYPRAVNVARVRTLLGELYELTADQRSERYRLRADRADTIVPAAAIFMRVASIFNASAIVAPGVGLKEGILDELIDKHFDRWDKASETRTVLDACVRLGRRYSFDEAHGERVARFALSLFDGMKPVHALGDRDRLLLHAAALLHDIGDFVRYDGHHKHSFYLIAHSDIMGLTMEERSVVANVARYHRKSAPDPAHPNFRELDKDARARVRSLVAILRIADALDREHVGKVSAVRAELNVSKRRLTLYLEGDEDRELEEWTVRAKSEMLSVSFELELHIDGRPAFPSRPVPK
jgi:exopolyphosphatase/guanosine-5'-triphosphate,3'-diphosphate pyrophosphatase